MKAKQFFLAGRLAAMALACITAVGLTACGGGGDDEPEANRPNSSETNKPDSSGTNNQNSEDALSDKTTPVTFNFEHGDNYVFDYSGSRYIGSDTLLGRYGATLDLRQGKHHLIWIKNLDHYGESMEWLYGGKGERYDSGIHFDTENKTVIDCNKPYFIDRVKYAELDIEVSPTLLPTQQVKYEELTSAIWIKVTDVTSDLTLPERDYSPSIARYTEPVVGKVTGVPHINTVSLANHSYKSDQYELNIHTYVDGWYYDQDTLLPEGVRIKVDEIRMLCPPEGMQDIQPKVEVLDVSGNSVPTTQLPTVSLKPGYTTILEGPIFSGSTADWTVTMQKYGY